MMDKPLIPIYGLDSVGIVVRDLWARMESFSRFLASPDGWSSILHQSV